MRRIYYRCTEAMFALWQFPQLILGLILVWYYKPNRSHVIIDAEGCHIRVLYSLRKKGCSCFGPIILAPTCLYRKDKSVALGRRSVADAIARSNDSKMFGIFYFMLVLARKVLGRNV